MQNKVNPDGLKHLAQQLLHRQLVPAGEVGVEVARADCRVDTGSMQADIRTQNARIENGNPTIEIAVGGGDYRGQIMRNGKEGKEVTYQLQWVIEDGFLENGAVAIANELIG
jgi:hypothetical protein